MADKVLHLDEAVGRGWPEAVLPLGLLLDEAADAAAKRNQTWGSYRRIGRCATMVINSSHRA
jgi:hypothetical protein